jgi:Nucleotidyl transferase of unknown function (DUF2204)
VSVSKDFEELFALLNAQGVKGLIVGGYAVTYHAKPRYTKDIDIWIEPTRENVERLLQALDEFGFGSLGLKAEDFSPGRFVQLGQPPNRIDLLTAIKGVAFDEAWESRVEDLFGEQRVCFLGKEELIQNKKAVGRPKDREDVRVLKRFTKKKS